MSDEPTPAAELPARTRANATRLREVATLFLKLGTISFGGPAAHVALMEEMVVRERQWLTKQQFLDLLGACNLIPGPTSTEMAINVGFARAGRMGLCVAGACFILPAALISGGLAWAYVRFGTLTQAGWLLGGVKAAVVAVIALAIWRLVQTAVKGVGLGVLGALALAAFFLGANSLVILIGGGLLGMLARQIASSRSGPNQGLLAPLLSGRRFFPARVFSAMLSYRLRWFTVAVVASAAGVATRPSIDQIGLFFLKVGAVLYGGGYVLLAFLEQGLVRQNAWLTRQQLLDAVAIGQFTPGPVLSTATFIGYILGGVPGAAIATVGIFLPSFFYVALLAPVLFRLRKSAWMSGFMDSVNVCAVALMGGVTFRLAADALQGWAMGGIALISFAILLRWKVDAAWVVLGGGIAGVLLGAFR
ncbi:MAG TPA: chromate efflux transporter [Candidatus Sulfotelmatobacter sp.]